MSQARTEDIHWTVYDLDLLPENEGTRYEIIEGELCVTRAPHSRHQQTCGRIFQQLNTWSEESNLGETIPSPGIIFSDTNNVIPDVVWVTKETYIQLIDEQGYLTGAPELVVEVLSESQQDQKRDRVAKLKLYSSSGVREYWIADWRSRKLEIYRRENGQLKLVATLFEKDLVTSALLPGFSCLVKRFFP
ncbi:Uma2 family endonuclease [Scytonema sp. NUACC21]